ncbi:hypothetical protein SAMN05216229_11227 [Geopseudomonas sagittaria]|jgi:hypothetical protein|uniref:Uncharacterized protein n=1 Tax=Geopseudomonas sagittaria TaxID=1135990 RepID=A0A1I5W0K6_9GAMM|nr:hypothetical protein [Pseudomonas sagittaria]SFQ13221.1 hypothetical protein SAMN05216229_11227 [Pseudomonas sagittaria]
MQPAIEIQAACLPIPEGYFSEVAICQCCKQAMLRERITKRYCSDKCKDRAYWYRRKLREQEIPQDESE